MIEASCTIASAFANLTASGGFFPLALDARLLIMFSASRLCQHTFLLNFTIESLERCLKRLMFADFNFRHRSHPSRGQFRAAWMNVLTYVMLPLRADLPRNYSVATYLCQAVVCDGVVAV